MQVVKKPQQWGRLGPTWAIAPQKKSLFYSLPFSLSSSHPLTLSLSLSHSILFHLFSVSRLSASRPAPGPSHPPAEWVPMGLSPTVKRQKTWSSHQLSGEVKNAWSYAYTAAYACTSSWLSSEKTLLLLQQKINPAENLHNRGTQHDRRRT